MFKKYFTVLIVLSWVALLSACGSITVKHELRPPTGIQKQAVLVSEGVKIVAETEQWELLPGIPTMPPKLFHTREARTFVNGKFTGFAAEMLFAKNVTTDWRSVENMHEINVPGNVVWRNSRIKNKVMDVKIHTDQGEPLFGKMVFLTAIDTIESSHARSTWTVSVPQRDIDLARSGQTVVKYQPAKVGVLDLVTWVLWMSKYPLAAAPTAEPTAEPTAAALKQLFF